MFRCRRSLILLAALGLVPLTGCALPNSPAHATVPREWRDRNSWGPEGHAARAAGTLKPPSYTPEMAAWREFGKKHIQEGDFLFRYGRSWDLVSRFTTALISDMSDSPFSHDAIAHWEGDTLFVYDSVPEPEGVRKMPFEFWALDVAPRSFAIKRLKPEYRCHIPAAMAYIEDCWQRQVPFDMFLHLDDEKLYCSEMLEKAFRSAGLVLSDPVPIRCLPHYPRWAVFGPLAETLTDIDLDEPVFPPGNPHFGLFSSPKLELVYSELSPHQEQRRSPPRCPPVPYP